MSRITLSLKLHLVLTGAAATLYSATPVPLAQHRAGILTTFLFILVAGVTLRVPGGAAAGLLATIFPILVADAIQGSALPATLLGRIGFAIGLIARGLIVGLLSHLTERLRSSEPRYRDLYFQAPDMYATVDMSSGKITDCNVS